MAYDPNFPADHQELDAAPFRDQYNALKALIDAQQTQIATLQSNLDDLSLEAGDSAAAITALQVADQPPCRGTIEAGSDRDLSAGELRTGIVPAGDNQNIFKKLLHTGTQLLHSASAFNN